MNKMIRYNEWINAVPSQDFAIERRPTYQRERFPDWFVQPCAVPGRSTRDDEWMAIRLLVSDLLLSKCVEVNPKIRGGVPVLKGTRISIAQMIGEVADGRSIIELADSFEIDVDTLRALFEGMAIQFDRSFLP